MKEQKIEEMARVIGSAIEFDRYDFCMEGKTEIIAEKAAKAFYDANYHKQTEGEWMQSEDWQYDYICSVCGNTAHKGDYGNYDSLSKYCPNCGAHMKGGA